MAVAGPVPVTAFAQGGGCWLYPAQDAVTVIDTPHTLLGSQQQTELSWCSLWPALSKPLSLFIRQGGETKWEGPHFWPQALVFTGETALVFRTCSSGVTPKPLDHLFLSPPASLGLCQHIVPDRQCWGRAWGGSGAAQARPQEGRAVWGVALQSPSNYACRQSAGWEQGQDLGEGCARGRLITGMATASLPAGWTHTLQLPWGSSGLQPPQVPC